MLGLLELGCYLRYLVRLLLIFDCCILAGVGRGDGLIGLAVL